MELSELVGDCKTMCHTLLKTVVTVVRAQLKDLHEASSAPAKAIQTILDSETIEPEVLLAATNTPQSRALRTQWVRYGAWRNLPSDIMSSILQSFQQLTSGPLDKLSDDDSATFASVHSWCASIATIQAMRRSLKPSETRLHLLIGTREMWLAGDVPAMLPTKLGMLFDMACSQSEAP